MNPIARAPSGTLLVELGRHILRGEDIGMAGGAVNLDIRGATLDELETHGLRPPRGIGHLVEHDKLSIVAGTEGAIEYGNGVVVAIDNEGGGKVARIAIVSRWSQAELLARARPAAAEPEPVALAEADAA